MSMESVDNWYFTKAQLELSPSKKCGIDSSKELSYRQQAANFIQDMGQRLQVSQLCINTAIVYMHRFYVFHSFSKIHRNAVSVCALFLAAKVEEQPRKLEHVIKVSHLCLHREDSPLDVRSELYMEKQLELVTNENIMLQTLGFVIGIEHPHTYVVKLCQLVKASKDLAQTSYFMATNSLHLTTMCLQYKPTVVACVCIHLACKWSNWKIEPCSEGKEWFYYVDKHVTLEQLEALTKEFLAILEKCPNRLKRRVVTSGAKDGSGPSPKKLPEEIVGRVEHQNADVRVENIKKEYSPLPSSSATFFVKKEVSEKPVEVPPTAPIESTQAVPCSPPNKKLKLENPHISLAVYREKRERLSEQKNSALAHQEMPSSSTGTPKLNATDKHFVANHEKRHPKPHAKPGEFVPHRTSEKSHNRHTVTNSHVDSASTEKINHHSPRMPPVVTLNKDSSHPRGNAVKHVTENSKGSDPFVLLTRVDQPVAEKKMFHQSETNQYPAPPSLDLKSSDIVREEDELKSRALNSIEQTINVNPCDNKSLLKAVEPLLSLKVIKQQKPKIVSTSLHNNHADSQPLSQGNPQSPTRDSAKANGTKVLESTPVNHRLQSVSEVNKIVDKNLEAFNKHDRREKHRHKHSVHSTGKDKISNHTTELPGDQNISGGIKITIPKDKIVLSGVRQDSSQKSNSAPKGECPVKKPLKIKISKPKTPETPTVVKPTPPGTGLKLVFTKDKTNAGSYSTSHKGERSSRKRDRSPKVPEQNSRSSLGSTSGKSSKVNKLEGASSKVGVTAEHNKLKRNSHHLEEPHHNAVAMKQPKMGMAYHQPNDVTQQPYSVPYGMPNFYQNYFPYQIPPTANMPYGHLQPPPPPHTSAAPPLPRDPPPPLPPQPPLPSE